MPTVMRQISLLHHQEGVSLMTSIQASLKRLSEASHCEMRKMRRCREYTKRSGRARVKGGGVGGSGYEVKWPAFEIGEVGVTQKRNHVIPCRSKADNGEQSKDALGMDRFILEGPSGKAKETFCDRCVGLCTLSHPVDAVKELVV